jgi:hypothetical protein
MARGSCTTPPVLRCTMVGCTGLRRWLARVARRSVARPYAASTQRRSAARCLRHAVRCSRCIVAVAFACCRVAHRSQRQRNPRFSRMKSPLQEQPVCYPAQYPLRYNVEYARGGAPVLCAAQQHRVCEAVVPRQHLAPPRCRPGARNSSYRFGKAPSESWLFISAIHSFAAINSAPRRAQSAAARQNAGAALRHGKWAPLRRRNWRRCNGQRCSVAMDNVAQAATNRGPEAKDNATDAMHRSPN